ncbi:MAG: hypothetical protein AAF417_01835 [Pseudomonadota bacterium]
MKFLIALLLGLVVGIGGALAGVYFNPFGERVSVSPLAVSQDRTLNLGFTAVPSEGVLYTNNGEESTPPFPEKTLELWEPTIRSTRVAVVELYNGRGLPIGIGVKFSSDSEATDVLNAKALVDSAWHIYLPGSGSLFVGQQENYWSYLRDIVTKTRWGSEKDWRGAWSSVMTAGPNAIGTGNVRGGSGEFAELRSEAIETLAAQAYSAERGPVSMDGNLTINLPDAASP